MKKIKSIVSCLLIVVISICCINFSANARIYTDTNGHWAQTYIDSLTNAGIMESSSTSYFYPEVTFTRQEAAKSACMLYKQASYASSPHPFTDVSASSPYSKYIKYMYDNGIVSGTSATTYSPSMGVKRQDLCVMLYNLYFTHIGVPKYNLMSKTTYNDDSNISNYAKDAVYTFQRLGIITEGGSFRPKDYTTRAEAATIIHFLRHYAMILCTPSQIQQTDSWCWAACAKIMAEYRYPGSKTQQQIVAEIKSRRDPEDQRESGNYMEVAAGATWATYYDINHTYGNVLSAETIVNTISEYKPVTVLNGVVDSYGIWHGHFMVCIGYVRNYSSINDNHYLYIYDVSNGSCFWVLYEDYKDGDNPIDAVRGKTYEHSAYAVE